MAPSLAVLHLAAAAATALTTASFLAAASSASSNPGPSSTTTTSAYYAAVENKLPSSGGMDLVCRALGGDQLLTEWSVVPRGRVPRGGRRVAELLLAGRRHARVVCSWAYEGNYLGGMPLLDSRWPDAQRCQDPATNGMCRVVFEGGMVRFEAPGGGGGTRVIGDLPVKRCRGHWLLFSTGCAYPDHPNPYAGRVLRNALEYFGV